MLNGKHKSIPVLALVAVLLLAGAPLPAADAALADVREAPWAREAIAEMNAFDIIAGYPDGFFRPYKSVTRLEAVAMLIRVLGLEDQAKARDKESVDYQMPPDLYWGRGYLILAVERGMLDRDYLHQLQPASAATRAEVAVLVYHALKLSRDGGALTFADAGQIPADYRDCVAAVVKRNIMQGLPGNLFGPNEEINRAQMAVLLSRLVENSFTNPYPARRYSGTISSVNAAGGQITIQGGSGSLTKTLASGCEVFLDGKSATAADLRVGDEVNLVLNKNNQVAFIKALRQTASVTYRGRVDSLSLINGENRLTLVDFDGRKITYPVSTAVRVTRSGSVKDISSVARNEFVEIKVAGDRIGEINFLSTSTIEGTVSSKSSSSLMVRKSSGSKTELEVPDNVVVLKNGSAKSYGDVASGGRVKVDIYDNKAVRIEILSGGALVGEIRSLDTSGTWGITIRDDDGNRVTYEVDDDVDVERDGDDIDFDDLDTGERVRLILDSDGVVTEIEVLNEGGDDDETLSGTVTDLDSGSTPEITIEDEDGDERSYDISDDAEVTRDGDDIGLDDILIGSEVEIEVEDGEVVRIEVTDDKDITVEGEVTRVYTSSEKITIKQSNGNTFTFYLKDGARLRDRNGNSIDLEDVKTGWDVEIELEDGKVKRLTRQ
ncbi:MAG: S-layer homology domain-containing protein [Peptococcaceae bacterium]|nr:S-layer homology domain-containing protein [Peptococcaceae bacterium]